MEKLLSKWVFDLETNSIRRANLKSGRNVTTNLGFCHCCYGETTGIHLSLNCQGANSNMPDFALWQEATSLKTTHTGFATTYILSQYES